MSADQIQRWVAGYDFHLPKNDRGSEAHACPVCVVDAAISSSLQGMDKTVLTQKAITNKFDAVISTSEHLVRVLKHWKLDMRNSKSERTRRQVVRGSIIEILNGLPALFAEKPIQNSAAHTEPRPRKSVTKPNAIKGICGPISASRPSLSPG